MKLVKNTFVTVSKYIAIAIGDRKATIAIEIDLDLKFEQDRDRYCDRNFHDRGHALPLNISRWYVQINAIYFDYILMHDKDIFCSMD